jgi:hypothetical protein
MSIPEALTALKAELSHVFASGFVDLLTQAFADATPIHQVEQQLWDRLLDVGCTCLAAFLDAHGSGDLGERLQLPDGRESQRLAELHERRYVSIFGEFCLRRTVYGSREGQALEFVPLDNRLQLPASVYSYLLQDWDQSLAMEQAFAQVNQTIQRMLHLRQAVDSLEGMNRQMAREVGCFRELYVTPPPAEEGALVVVTADCKGVVIRGQGSPTVCGGQRVGGTRANQKRMAAVGAVYTVDPYVRTAADVVAALFRDPGYEPGPRPQPRHKHVWASLSEPSGRQRSGIDVVFDWLAWEHGQRSPDPGRPTLLLCDGQEALWQACADAFPDQPTVSILDLLHVTPRLWEAAKVLCGDRGPEVVPWVRRWLTQVLEGKVESVLRGLNRLGREQRLRGSKKTKLHRIVGYLRKNRSRMRYDVYLREGYPIASGVIEGACRHLVKDRLERAGMHWTLEGAQAMLDLRSVHVNDQWQAYQKYRIEAENERLYPHRNLVAGEAFFTVAA